jgi:hypothetical protein
MDSAQWIVLITAALLASVLIGRRSLLVLARLRGREETSRMACPKGRGRVECTMVFDDESGACVGVERCSAFRGGPLRCDQECAKLVNLGIPLHDEPRAREGEERAGTEAV